MLPEPGNAPERSAFIETIVREWRSVEDIPVGQRATILALAEEELAKRSQDLTYFDQVLYSEGLEDVIPPIDASEQDLFDIREIVRSLRATLDVTTGEHDRV